jgi:hypothetical protein
VVWVSLSINEKREKQINVKTKRKTPNMRAKMKVGTAGSKEEGELKLKKSSLQRQSTEK